MHDDVSYWLKSLVCCGYLVTKRKAVLATQSVLLITNLWIPPCSYQRRHLIARTVAAP